MEFTSDDPERGEIMQICMVAHTFSDEKYRLGDEDFMGDDSIEFECLGRVRSPWTASDWVTENQSDLLKACLTDGAGPETMAVLVADFLEKARKRFSAGTITVCGWCVANDYFLLKRMLPGYAHINYKTIELDNLATGLFGAPSGFDGEEQIEHFLGVKREGANHDALYDARYQMKAVRKALRLAQERLDETREEAYRG